MSDRAAETLAGLFDVRDTRVVVTGAASGVGFAMAEVLADCGAHITLADIDEVRLTRSVSSLTDRVGHARGIVADVRDENAVQSLFDQVVDADGGVDVVFAN